MSTGSDTFLHTEPCPKCGSKDNLKRYGDGHSHCFSQGCGYHEFPDGREPPEFTKRKALGLLHGSVPPEGRPGRHLTAETMARVGMSCGFDKNGTKVILYNYRSRDGEVVAQKLRYGDKKRGFPWAGSPKITVPFGFHLQPGGGKRLIITEGEDDMASVFQALGGKWPVWSIQNGSSGAKKDLLAVLPDLELFEEVVLCLDNDEPGRAAAKECAEALSGGKCKIKIASLPLKDASDMLMAGRVEELIHGVLFRAKEFRPDGILLSGEVLEKLKTRRSRAVQGLDYPWPGLTKVTMGLRPRELVIVAAGTKIGKSEFLRQIGYDIHTRHKQNVGFMSLEESTDTTLEALIGLHLRKRLKLVPDITEDAIDTAYGELIDGRPIPFFDHFGSTDVDNLLSKLRFMVRGLGCQWIILDHLSIVTSGQTGDERRNIDMLMTGLRQLVENTDVGIVAACHLKRPEGNPSFEEGLDPTLAHFRGSGAIAQLCDMAIGLSRNKNDPELRNRTKVRVLANRYTGDDGCDACWLDYDKETGWLNEVPEEALSSLEDDMGF